MKPAPFLYACAASVEEALSLLAEHGEDARVLAGGQSLLPLMNLRLARPTVLVDLNRVGELAYVSVADGLRVGAMTRQRELERSPTVAAACPLVARATRFVAHFQIRNRGTAGGSLAHADPAAEYPTVAVALGAELLLRGPSGTRTVAAEDFFIGPLMTALDPGELLIEVRFPDWGVAHGFQEIARRHGDFAIASVAAALEVHGDGTIGRAGIGLGGVAPTPVKAREAEDLLAGERPTDELLAVVARTAAAAARPVSDIHGSARYRQALTETLTLRALRQASGRKEEYTNSGH